MNIKRRIAAVVAVLASVLLLNGCYSAIDKPVGELPEDIPPVIGEEYIPGGEENNKEEPFQGQTTEPKEENGGGASQNTPEVSVPKVKTVSYISVNADGINIRSGAGTGYAVRGVSEKSSIYALDGETGGWYKTGYKNKSAYISSKYCERLEMTASEDGRIEAVIAEGTKLLGTEYVYGAVRYHDGNGRLLKGFTTDAFDCSSLMQYIFYKGAQVNLQVNTRTQINQGKTVKRSELKRGDLMFFTNASRKNNTGIERVGHVALYLGDNLILHTASDYARIEQVTPLRWSYFIQGQRIF